MRDYTTPRRHIIYGVFDNKTLVYVGSSYLTIDRVEYNHRNWKTLTGLDGSPYYGSYFRQALTNHGSDWEFKVLISRECTRADAEWLEEKMIMLTEPKYNKDITPYKTSISVGRIQED